MEDWDSRKKFMLLAIGFFGTAVIGLIVGIWTPISARLGDWGSYFSAIAAFLAIGFGVFGFWETTDTNRREHRAYLRVDVTRVELTDPKDIESLAIHIAVTNTGRTPAMMVIGAIQAAVYREPAPEADIWPELTPVVYTNFMFQVVPCGAPETVTKKPVKASCQEEVIPEIISTELSRTMRILFIKVHIRYMTVFGEVMWETRICKFGGYPPRGRQKPEAPYDLVPDDTAGALPVGFLT